MAELKGNIYKNGEIILRDINIFIYEHQSESGLKSWNGSFESEISPGLNDNGYEIELSDGRKGNILIGDCTHDEVHTVQFSGNGPLK